MKEPSREKALLTLHVIAEVHFLHGHVKMYVMGLPFCWTTILFDLAPSCIVEVVGIPMGSNCAPLVADLVLFRYKRDFMMSLSDDKQADV